MWSLIQTVPNCNARAALKALPTSFVHTEAASP